MERKKTKLPFPAASCTHVVKKKKYNKWCQSALKRCAYCTVLFVTLWSAIESMQHISRESKHSRQVFRIFYSIPFYFIQYVCLSTMQFFPPSFHRHTDYEPRLMHVWLLCRSAQCPAGTHLVTPYLCSSLIAFSYSSPVKCRKNRYPLINSKAVKILSSPKGHVSSEEVLNQSLPSWNKKVEPSGRKSWLVASCNKNVPLLRCIKVERLHNANDMFP